MPMSQTDDRPTTWFRERFPTETVSGVEMVYNAESSRTEYYSVSWLAETFETTITTAENPRQRLAEECDRRGYTQLRDLFAADGS